MTIDWLYRETGFSSVAVIGDEVVLYPAFLEDRQATEFFGILHKEICWQKETIMMYGKSIEVPRLVAWYGDAGKIYRYSKVAHQPQPWTPVLSRLRTDVEQYLGVRFNSVLLNLYRNGNDSVAWHSDDEPELGSEPVIASLSLGAERVFQFRNSLNKPDRRQVSLPNGSLLLMSGRSQRDWQHQLPKKPAITRARINLTFRSIQ